MPTSPESPVTTPRPIVRSTERILYQTAEFRIGTFRCPVDHPGFRTAGPIEGYTIAFPRTAVWIQHEHGRPFVADPSVATVYNLGQPYHRLPLAPDGDRADWFSVSRPIAEGIVRGIVPEAADGERPLPVAWGPVPTSLYYRQRLLLSRLASGQALDPFEIEQEVIVLFGTVLEQALRRNRATRRRPPTREQRERVERARAALAGRPFDRLTVHELATAVGCSPFHLCRIFRRCTGMTLHTYRLELRSRLALEHLETGCASLSRLAHTMGFSSHSHFAAEVRRRLGTSPSRIRRTLSRFATLTARKSRIPVRTESRSRYSTPR